MTKEYTNKDIYEFLSEEIKLHPDIENMSAAELKKRKDDADFWEGLLEQLDCFRICDVCHKPMIEGYCIESGVSYYCCDECLHQDMTEDEYEELYNDVRGETYYTSWLELSEMFKEKICNTAFYSITE